jgi:hypothetical protein
MEPLARAIIPMRMDERVVEDEDFDSNIRSSGVAVEVAEEIAFTTFGRVRSFECRVDLDS